MNALKNSYRGLLGLWVMGHGTFGGAAPALEGIEGMNSQEWSVGIFVFLIICIIVFTLIVLKFMLGDRNKGLKTGEKVMFAWIILGIVVAVIFGALQLLHGRLF